jgi:hypothetical protein
MKTSNKLLLLFCGIIVALTLLSNIVLRANLHNKDYYSGNPFSPTQDKHDFRPKPPVTLQPFKIIKLVGNPDSRGIEINHKDTYTVYKNQFEDTSAINYHQVGDTLLLQLDQNGITVNCPSFSTVILGDHTSANVRGFQLPALTVSGGKESGLLLDGAQLGKLDVIGEKTNLMLYIGTKVDTLNLVLGRGSELLALDVPFQQVNMQLDSLAKFDIQGRSISAFRQIK